MSVSSKQPASTIEQWLSRATAQLAQVGIPTARLDAELILCHMLGVDRAWLVIHSDESLTRAALSQKGGERRMGLKEYGEQLLVRRLNREPLAYLFGVKEFYGRDFIVNKDVLVPRPETEALVELTKQHAKGKTLLDVGTGSGALGLTLALELPGVATTLADISPEALMVAKKNAKKLGLKAVEFVESDLLEHWIDQSLSGAFAIIVANLPYVDRTWERSPETNHEPYQALFARDGGLELIRQLIDQAPSVLTTDGLLVLEADPEQHDAIIDHASDSFTLVDRRDYGLLLQRR